MSNVTPIRRNAEAPPPYYPVTRNGRRVRLPLEALTPAEVLAIGERLRIEAEAHFKHAEALRALVRARQLKPGAPPTEE